MPQLQHPPVLDLRRDRGALERLVAPQIVGGERPSRNSPVASMALTLEFHCRKYLGRMTYGQTFTAGRSMWKLSRSRIDASALHRRHPGRRAAADRVVADLLAARRVGLGVPAPAVVEEPRARILIAVVARAHGHRDDAREGGAEPADLVARERAGAASRVDARLVEHLV